METFHTLEKKPNTSIALGFFDGIHLAHRQIITTLVKNAKKNGTKSAIISFSENPANYFSETKTPAIQTYKDKEIILSALGVDYFFELNFELFKDISALDYLKALVKNFSPREIVIGFDHHFGKNKTGNAQFLKEHEKEFGYDCIVIPEQKIICEKISSTFLRKTIQRGDLELAKAMLGRYFSIRNSVVKGSGMARKLGFPTANIIWANNIVRLPYGVYFGFCQIDGPLHPALISWGKKPTLSAGEEEFLEAHIFGIDKNLYGKIINVLFERKVRNEIKFQNVAQLKSQIQNDYQAFRKWIAYCQKITPPVDL